MKENLYYIVMQYVDGGTREKYCCGAWSTSPTTR
jgi:hypothetical protein